MHLAMTWDGSYIGTSIIKWTSFLLCGSAVHVTPMLKDAHTHCLSASRLAASKDKVMDNSASKGVQRILISLAISFSAHLKNCDIARVNREAKKLGGRETMAQESSSPRSYLLPRLHILADQECSY